ncbi:MAG: hypothetical protein ACFFCW_04605, partial [Candidatus Hodarchaeota archaeon]
LTLFFEIAEYWAFKNAEEEGKLRDCGYLPSELIEKQAQEVIERSHDVQLHIHPQWLGSRYVNGHWKLNRDYWRLSNLPHGLGNIHDMLSIKGVLHKGKKDLEDMLKRIDPTYQCVALRVGGWCIQPERHVIEAMNSVGLIADTSVFKGGYVNSNRAYYDFRNAHANCGFWWCNRDNINQSLGSKGNILEIPIYSLFFPNNKKTIIRTLLRGLKRFYTPGEYLSASDSPSESIMPRKGVSAKDIINYWCGRTPIKWDFCNLSYDDMILFLDKAMEEYKETNVCFPLVMIGHSKYFTNRRAFKKFLRNVTSNYVKSGVVEFSNMRDVIRQITKTKGGYEIP